MNAPLRIALASLALWAMVLAGCSRPPDIIGVDNPAVPVAAVPEVTRQNLFIVSTREPSVELGAFLSAGRAQELTLASVTVTIPPTHIVGEIERPTRLPPDPRTEFTVVEPAFYRADAAFVAQINRELARRPRADRQLLVFAHGYNNTATDGVLRLAQFVEDSGFKGVPILFTWASAARTPRYVYDMNSALVARGKVKELADIVSRTRADSADILAHSMGTLLIMEGLVDLEQAGTLGRRGAINHIMLASPDIDIDLFRTQLNQLPREIREKIFVLVSRDDRALRASSVLAGGVPRVGMADSEELEGLGLTVIDMSEIDDSSAGSHAKFAGSPEVVRLIGAALTEVGRFDAGNTPGLRDLLATTPIRIFGN
jgi:esterase/lipase superfamily enzyme